MVRQTEFRCGYVAIVGRPNVGKSTLLNRLVGQKISITSRRPQTTRTNILGIRTTTDAQLIFIDTPGLDAPSEQALNRYMNRTACSVLDCVDVHLFVVEAQAWRDEDRFVLDRLMQRGAPIVLAVNKIDALPDKKQLLPYIAQLSGQADFAAVIPLSASKGDNVESLVTDLIGRMPCAAALFPVDQVTDRSMRFVAAELIREKLMRRLSAEVPYGLAIEIDRFEELEGLARIDAQIWVERPGQKAIVVGSGGRVLKEVGTQVRLELERLL